MRWFRFISYSLDDEKESEIFCQLRSLSLFRINTFAYDFKGPIFQQKVMNKAQLFLFTYLTEKLILYTGTLPANVLNLCIK
jgi:hypothetical protein